MIAHPHAGADGKTLIGGGHLCATYDGDQGKGTPGDEVTSTTKARALPRRARAEASEQSWALALP